MRIYYPFIFLPIISESSTPLKFVVSDIHIYASGRILWGEKGD